MDALKRTWKLIRSRIGLMSRSARIAAALAGLMLMAGGAYLAFGGGSDELSPVVSQQLGDAELTAWASALAMHGIDAQVRDRRIMASPADLQRARAVLAYEGMVSRDLVGAFEQVAREDDIWRTAEQNDKRWQAAKMSTLSKLIGMFPPVRAATVIIEPGSPRTLGGQAQSATAAVNVTLKDGQKMSGQLVDAIADLVCGSVAGMDRQDVRIVDSSGKSHSAGPRGVVTAEYQLENLRQAEAYFAQKIRLALGYIDHVVIGVDVAPAELSKCRCATVSVPRSYLLASGGLDGAADRSLPVAAHLNKIQRAAMKAIGATNPADVTVDWHYDAPAPSPSAAPARDAAQTGVRTAGITLTASVLLLAFAAVVANRLRRRRGTGVGGTGFPACVPLSQPGKAVRSGTLGLLQHIDTDGLIELVRGEHPRTIAIVLSHLGLAKAAAVLSALPPQEQIDVSRRMAVLDKLDSRAVGDVERSLWSRLAATPASRLEQLGGVAVVAQILHQAGYATGKAVLQGLAGQEPDLAESIRRRMFSLEDLSALPTEKLRAAVADVDHEELALALCAAAENVKARILSAIGGQAARRVRELIGRISPVRLSDVEAAQESVLEAARQFEEGRYVAEHSRQAGEVKV